MDHQTLTNLRRFCEPDILLQRLINVNSSAGVNIRSKSKNTTVNKLRSGGIGSLPGTCSIFKRGRNGIKGEQAPQITSKRDAGREGGYFGVKRIGMTVGNPRKMP